MDDLGYNLFDKKDNFYNDICTPYTKENKTDILLKDRQNNIYNEYVNPVCQKGCFTLSYNKTTKKMICNCEVQKNNIDLNSTKIFSYMNNITNAFFKAITNSNFRVLKYYKLTFSIKYIFKNIGKIIMTIIYLINLIIILIYLIKDRKTINKYLNEILNHKLHNINYKVHRSNKKMKTQINVNNKEIEVIKHKYIKREKAKIKNKKEDNFYNKKNVPPTKARNRTIRIKSINKKENENKNSKNSIFTNTNALLPEENWHSKYIKNKLTLININIYPNHKKSQKNININRIKNEIIKNNKISENKRSKDLINKKLLKRNNNNFMDMNDKELNDLKYKKAIKYDKRTYFQYYWSLLKKKHLILFTFYPQKDYNLITLKISLFLLSFSLYFTINGFFFNDNTIHKIYADYGIYNFLYQIPVILYSSLVSTVTNMLLKLLILSEKYILEIKHEAKLETAKYILKTNQKYLSIKFILFIIVSNVLLLLFWIFISSFCAVYINSQLSLIKDTIFSFILSMLYPFWLNLFPGLLRIAALKAEKKNKEFIYQLSKILAVIL